MEEDTVKESVGLVEIRCLIRAFLNSDKGSPKVRKYISSVKDDDSLLLIYLKGRKYRVNYAWETLKRKAEVRFDEYPESFPETVPDALLTLTKNGIMGVLKTRDKFGRRILCFNIGKWEPNKIALDQVSPVGTYYLDKLMLDEDVMNNGLILIQNCDGMGFKHLRQYSFRALKRQQDIYYYAYPVQLKAVYYLNAPPYYGYLHKIVKPFLSEKLKERLFISTRERKFEVLHENLSLLILILRKLFAILQFVFLQRRQSFL